MRRRKKRRSTVCRWKFLGSIKLSCLQQWKYEVKFSETYAHSNVNRCLVCFLLDCYWIQMKKSSTWGKKSCRRGKYFQYLEEDKSSTKNVKEWKFFRRFTHDFKNDLTCCMKISTSYQFVRNHWDTSTLKGFIESLKLQSWKIWKKSALILLKHAGTSGEFFLFFLHLPF